MPMARKRRQTIEPKADLDYEEGRLERNEGLGDLACNPLSRRAVRHADPGKLSAV